MKSLLLKLAVLAVVLAALAIGGPKTLRWYKYEYSFGPALELTANSNDSAPASIPKPKLPEGWGGTPNVFLISVDTLRADHLGVYGHSRETSSAIDGLAADGIVFDRAFVTSPKTTPSLASLLTGLSVKTHRVHQLRIPVDTSIPLISEMLKERGYATSGFCGQFNCNRKFGFSEGFDHYDDDFDFTDSGSTDRVGGGFYPRSEKRAEYLVGETIGWIESQQKSDAAAPFFTWLHLMDPHGGYSPPDPYQKIFSGPSSFSDHSFRGQTIPDDLMPNQVKIEGVDSYDEYLNLYDAEIRYADDELARLFAFLKQEGLYDDALIIFASDHGEFMGENDSGVDLFSHGGTLFDPEIRTPLIVKLPGNALAGTRTDQLVSTADIVPTIVSYVGGKAEYAEGWNLMTSVPALSAVAPRQVVFAQRPTKRSEFAARNQDYKLLFRTMLSYEDLIAKLSQGESVTGHYRLYDLNEDPLERNPLSEGHETALAALAGPLADWLAEARTVDLEESTTEAPDEETLRHLQALGYAE